jgi:hypothetical protein
VKDTAVLNEILRRGLIAAQQKRIIIKQYCDVEKVAGIPATKNFSKNIKKMKK